MKGTFPLVLLSLWASNNARGELITWKKLQLWTLQEVRENTRPRSALALEMARALKSEKFTLLNFQKVSIMCPRWLSPSGEDVLMAVTSKTEAWQKHYLRLSLFLSEAAVCRQNKSFTAKRIPWNLQWSWYRRRLFPLQMCSNVQRPR